jgi:hypothetical protein
MIAIGKLDAVAFEAWVFPTTRIARPGLPARTLGGPANGLRKRLINLSSLCWSIVNGLSPARLRMNPHFAAMEYLQAGACRSLMETLDAMEKHEDLSSEDRRR